MLKRMRKNIRKKAVQNKESNFHQPFIPVSASVLVFQLTFKNIGKSIHIICSLFLNFLTYLPESQSQIYKKKNCQFIQTNYEFSPDPGFVQMG